MVYIAEIKALGGEDDPFWAYKFYWNRYANTEKPTPNTYAWASYKFADEGVGYNFNIPDAHTYIHETGHMFGLQMCIRDRVNPCFWRIRSFPDARIR